MSMGRLANSAAALAITATMAANGAEAMTDRETKRLVRGCESANGYLASSDRTLKSALEKLDEILPEFGSAIERAGDDRVRTNNYNLAIKYLDNISDTYDKAIDRVSQGFQTKTEVYRELSESGLIGVAEDFCSSDGHEELQSLVDQVTKKKASVKAELEALAKEHEAESKKRIIAQENQEYEEHVFHSVEKQARQKAAGDPVTPIDYNKPPSEVVTDTLAKCEDLQDVASHHFNIAARHANRAEWYINQIELSGDDASANLTSGFKAAVGYYNESMKLAMGGVNLEKRESMKTELKDSGVVDENKLALCDHKVGNAPRLGEGAEELRKSMNLPPAPGL